MEKGPVPDLNQCYPRTDVTAVPAMSYVPELVLDPRTRHHAGSTDVVLEVKNGNRSVLTRNPVAAIDRCNLSRHPLRGESQPRGEMNQNK